MGSDTDREARFKATLRLNLSINDGNSHVYWKHDGKRFANKAVGGAKPKVWMIHCSSTTLKFRTGKTYQLSLTSSRPVQLRERSGRWRLIEVDAAGAELELEPSVFAAHVCAPHSDKAPALQPDALPPRAADPGSPAGGDLPKAASGAKADAPLIRLSSDGGDAAPPTRAEDRAAFAGTSSGGAPAADLASSAAEPGPGLKTVATAAEAVSPGAAAADAVSTGADDASADPFALQWQRGSCDDTRSTFTASLRCVWPPTGAGRRQYLLLECYVEDFGVVSLPLQIKVYSPTDKAALQSFPLRFVQYDFREDSSGAGDLYSINFYRY